MMQHWILGVELDGLVDVLLEREAVLDLLLHGAELGAGADRHAVPLVRLCARLLGQRALRERYR